MSPHQQQEEEQEEEEEEEEEQQQQQQQFLPFVDLAGAGKNKQCCLLQSKVPHASGQKFPQITNNNIRWPLYTFSIHIYYCFSFTISYINLTNS